MKKIIKQGIVIGLLICLYQVGLFSQPIVVKPYLQNNCPTEVTIMWECATAGTGEIEWGTDPFTLSQNVNSTSITGSGSSQIHTAIITPLNNSTKYYYRVKMAGGQSSTLYSFITAPHSTAEMSVQFMAVSDMQRDGSHPNKWNEIVEQGMVPIILSEVGSQLSDLEGILIPGDLVPTGGSYSQWKDYFFNPADSLMPYVPTYPVLGNHEYFGGGLPNFLKYFTLPDNGPAGLQNQCWYKDISNVRIIGFDSNTSVANKTAQLDWLSSVLTSTCSLAEIDFVFAQLHHPYKSELWTPGESDFTGQLIDSLEQFTEVCGKASIHLFGHTHGYSRGESRDHEHLWINVATAGGAIDNWGEFPNADYKEFVKSQDEYGFVLIDVQAGDDPRFTVKRFSRGDQDITLNNILRDEITLIKNEKPPRKPINVFPVGDTILSPCVVFKGSQFYGVEDSIQGAHWQVARSGDFVDSIVGEQWFQNENFYNEIDQQAGDDLTDVTIENLPLDTLLEWRVRYRDQYLKWSDWSDATDVFIESAGDTVSPNLIINEGAEDLLSGWTGDIEALLNGECNSVAPHTGSYNFAVGGVCSNEMSFGEAFQQIDLSAYVSDISNGLLSAHFGGFLRDYSGSDIPEMSIAFYNNGTLISSSPFISNASGSWTDVKLTIPIPITTTSCRIVLNGTRNAGSDNDSYFDDLYLYLVTTVGCPSCYGNSNIDVDNDGYCDDIDCDDNNNLIYPGALEICDGLDNDCNGHADFGAVVNWTGLGGDNDWGNPQNWDQNEIPLPCQHVIINNTANVLIDSVYACLSLDIGTSNQLTIASQSLLVVDGSNVNAQPSVKVSGIMNINGKCEIKKSTNLGFEVYGILTNYNKVTASQISLESILVRNGGRFESIGTTIIK